MMMLHHKKFIIEVCLQLQSIHVRICLLAILVNPSNINTCLGGTHTGSCRQTDRITYRALRQLIYRIRIPHSKNSHTNSAAASSLHGYWLHSQSCRSHATCTCMSLYIPITRTQLSMCVVHTHALSPDTHTYIDRYTRTSVLLFPRLSHAVGQLCS